ncbi:unnamed protein product [Rangifer tarandus platyrhynchus]|uniref:Uncharacterized protein n=2 Tax=Rangifer tarandus platyrhynchus TaxID=3082113 RepID=A0ACB0EG22_RANTA|nr:unnamed protein product [Rangifer tarandus platyrhynchus]CAI9699324.1 unnamed protein product [Rangifer tarandus platyrhynchus]
MGMDARTARAAEERQRFPPPVRLPASPVPATPRTGIPARRPGRQLQSSWLPRSSTSCCLLAPGLPSASPLRLRSALLGAEAVVSCTRRRPRCSPSAV